MNGLPALPGQPGSFPLPNAGQPGTVFAQQQANPIHPAAQAARGMNPTAQTQAKMPGGSYR